MRKAVLLGAGLSLLMSVAAEAAMVQHTISFTQIYKTPGNSGLVGQISIDASLLGAGQENKTFTFVPDSPETPPISDFSVVGPIHEFDWFRPASRYSFKPLVIYTDSAGEVSNITGFLHYSGNPATQIELGRSTGTTLIGDPMAPNEWILYQALGGGTSSDNVAVAAGYYYIERTSPIPIPGAVWLLGTGLLGLVGFHRKT
jgi:hypothetical protein